MAIYALYGQVEEAERDRFSSIGVRRATEVRFSTARDEGSKVEVEIRDDEVVAVTLEGGFTLWFRGKDLERELGEKTRDGALTLKLGLGVETEERGLGGWVLKGLEIFGIEPAEYLVTKTAKAIERGNADVLRRLDPGATRPWEEKAWSPVEDPSPETPDNQPLLLFLHGTFSSTRGSFGELFKAPGPAARLQTNYQGRIYGFEHRTLTESPIANALALVKQLPVEARLHLVSHSRAGLIGDLLCLAPVIEQQELVSPEDLRRFSPADQRDLPLLIRELREKRPRVERFVRVASPSRGTTLASGRLDRWLSVVFYLISKVPLLGEPIANVAKEFVLAALKEPRDAEGLPGLAAMMPDSPLIGLLNRPQLEIPGPALLAVIAGNVQDRGLWGRLKLLLPDLFFAGDHDLMVNTGSMYGGLRRERGWYCFDQGSDVNHFNYFGISAEIGKEPVSQPITVDALLLGLGLLGEPPGQLYRPLAEAPVIVPARSAGGVSGRRPVLFVLPGIMGSSLAVRDASEEVWLSFHRLVRGQLERLRMDQPLPIKPTGLLGRAYGDLLDFLERSHDVLPFPYDWRRSVREAAGLLAEEVNRALERTEATKQPVRILAHSMGGL